MPAIVNTHVHLASTREDRVGQLQHMAYYGAGMVVSLGSDEGLVGLEMRDEAVPDGALSRTAGRGITSPEPGRSEVPFWVTSTEEARAAVQELAAYEVDFVKIWVDDRNGQYERLSPELYGAVIDEAHAHGLRVTAHIFRLEDAKGLLRAGIDAFAHGIRDRDIDDELLALWKERPNVVLVPNLPGPGVAEDLGWLSGTVPAGELREIQERSTDRPAAQEAFGVQARNLARLHQAGVRIAFGTDGSTPWAVHQEMADMVRSGMTPAEVIVAATSGSAELMELDDVGSVAVGKSADFIVLNANPLADITNTREIDAVYLRGIAVDRDALSARFSGGTSQ
jgi:imidazolonepropionase-like amidohydrolase